MNMHSSVYLGSSDLSSNFPQPPKNSLSFLNFPLGQPSDGSFPDQSAASNVFLPSMALQSATQPNLFSLHSQPNNANQSMNFSDLANRPAGFSMHSLQGQVPVQPGQNSLGIDQPRFDLTDFPALSGAADPASGDKSLGGAPAPGLALNLGQLGPEYTDESLRRLAGSAAPQSRLNLVQQQLNQLAPVNVNVPVGVNAGLGVLGQQRLQNQNNQQNTNQQTQQTQQQAPGAGRKLHADRFGLTGLLSVIRNTDPDLNTLALGTDLTTLGLNLNSTEVLYSTFAYPALDLPTRTEPDYVLPYCYYMQPPALKTSHLAKFTLETLFYIFYNMPKDTLQVYAAKELYNREWRYHKELKLWFTRTTPNPNDPVDPATGAPPQAAYMYFDISTWERKIFRDTHILQPHKFMTEEELQSL